MPFPRTVLPDVTLQWRLGRPVLVDSHSRLWWYVLARAVAAVIFGIATIAWPRHTAMALVALFGTYVTIDGLTALVLAARDETGRTSASHLMSGAVSLAASALALLRPRLLALTLVMVIGLWLILRGLTEAVVTIREARRARGGSHAAAQRNFRMVNGVMSIVFGAGVMLWPHIGGLGLMWATGAWAIVHGLLMIPYALHLREAGKDA